jgi:hypothetical protein
MKTITPAPSLRLRSLLAGAAFALASLPAAAQQPLEPFTADYQASYMGMQADGQMKLARVGEDRWRYSLDISNALANLSQSTVFEVRDGKWWPITGSDASTVLVKQEQRKASYDWDNRTARWTGDVKPERAGPVKLQPGDMDALMVNLALARDLAAGKPLEYRLVDNGRIKQLDYEVAGRETITIAGQPRQATKLVNTDGDKQTIAWVVEGMPVPAKILRREDGADALQLTVESVH